MKKRRVVSEYVVSENGCFLQNGFPYACMGGVRAAGFPPGTKAEIAVYEDVEEATTERDLIIPDDAFWITSQVEPKRHQLIVQSVVVAVVDDGGDGYPPTYKICGAIWHKADELHTAKQACYIALANAGKDGFGWKKKEPAKSKCLRCNGMGTILQPCEIHTGTVPVTCPECHGTGVEPDEQ
jgi:hypothetical protein